MDNDFGIPAPLKTGHVRGANPRKGFMNQKGHIILILLVAFVILAIIPVLLSAVFWQVKIVAQLIMVFVIYTTVRGFMGSGLPVILISAILIYFLVFKYFEIALSLYIFQILLSLQFLSIVIWGLGRTLGQ